MNIVRTRHKYKTTYEVYWQTSIWMDHLHSVLVTLALYGLAAPFFPAKFPKKHAIHAAGQCSDCFRSFRFKVRVNNHISVEWQFKKSIHLQFANSTVRRRRPNLIMTKSQNQLFATIFERNIAKATMTLPITDLFFVLLCAALTLSSYYASRKSTRNIYISRRRWRTTRTTVQWKAHTCPDCSLFMVYAIGRLSIDWIGFVMHNLKRSHALVAVSLFVPLTTFLPFAHFLFRIDRKISISLLLHLVWIGRNVLWMATMHLSIIPIRSVRIYSIHCLRTYFVFFIQTRCRCVIEPKSL